MLSTVDNNLEEDSVADLMTKADLDGDGVISFEEFYQLIMGKAPPATSPDTAKARPRRSHTLAQGKGRMMMDELDEQQEEEEGVAKGTGAAKPRTPPRPQTPPDEDEPKPRGLAGSLAVVAQSATMDGGSTTEEEEEEQPLTLQDQIDDALDGGFSDVAAMRALLAVAATAGHSHPSVVALEMKLEDLDAAAAAAFLPGDTKAPENGTGAAASLAGKLLMGGLKAPILEPEPEPEEVTGAVSKPGLLSIKVWQARNIPKMDRFGTTDAFAVVDCGGDSRETAVVESCEPYWGTTFDYELQKAPKFAMVTVQDKDTTSSEKIGEIRLNMADFADGKEHEGWYTMSPAAGGVKMASPQSKSRRRMSITFVPDTSKGLGDVRLTVTYTAPVVAPAAGAPPKKQYLHPVGQLGVLHVTLIQARGLPKMDRFSHTDSYAKVQFREEIGDTFVAMDTEEPKWNQEFSFEIDKRTELHGGFLQCSIWDKDEGPDPDDIIGQCELQLHDDLMLGREEDVWLQLRAATGSPGGKSLGQLNCKVSFEPHRAPEWVDELDGAYDPIRSAYSYLKMTSPVHRKNEMLKAQPRFLGKVGICVMEGRGLPKMDRFGGTDAYCEVEFAGMVRHTEVAKDGISPFWNAEFDFDVENRMRGMKVTVFDQELRGSDEPIGCIVLPITSTMLVRFHHVSSRFITFSHVFLTFSLAGDGAGSARGGVGSREVA